MKNLTDILSSLKQPRMAMDEAEKRLLQSQDLRNYVNWYYSYGQLKFALSPVGRSLVA